MFSAARRRTLISLVAGAALPLAFAPFGWFWVAPLSYAALFYVWRGASPGRAFRMGWLFGAASFLGGIYWIYISVHGFGGAPAALAVLLTGALVAVMALYSGAVGWIAARWFGTGGRGVWLGVLPALWVLGEWWRGWFLTGFGWLSAGYSQTDSWLLAYAPIGGLLAVSWAVLLLAGAAVCVVCGDEHERRTAVAAAALLTGVAFFMNETRWTDPKGSFLTTALVQGAVPQDRKWLPAQLPVTLELYNSLTAEAHGSQLIVWPEAAIPELYENLAGYLGDVERSAAGSMVLVGILRYHEPSSSAMNSLIALGKPGVAYDKRHLVPYGEYFPVPGFVRGWLRAMELPFTDLRPGEPGQPPLDLLDERIAVTICYEDVFGAEQLRSLPEATLLVNVSNDAWFGESIAAHQHLQIARFRAAEAGRYLLRSTNTGITAVIDPHGRVVGKLPQFEPGVLRATVQGFTGATPYARLGDYAALALAGIVLAAQLLMTKLTIRRGT